MEDAAAHVSGKQIRTHSPALPLRPSILLNMLLSYLSTYQLSAMWLLNLMKKDILCVCVCVNACVCVRASLNAHVHVCSDE